MITSLSLVVPLPRRSTAMSGQDQAHTILAFGSCSEEWPLRNTASSRAIYEVLEKRGARVSTVTYQFRRRNHALRCGVSEDPDGVV